MDFTMETWNLTSLMSKEPEFVSQMECYGVDVVGLTSTQYGLQYQISQLVQSLSLLVQSSTGDRPQAGLGIFTSPKLNSFTFGVFPGGQEDCIYDSLEGKLSLWF